MGILLYPKLKPLLQCYPQLRLEMVAENRRVNIVQEGFDCGVRIGTLLEKDMVGQPISQAIPMRLIASPDYLAKHGTPQTLDDLDKHACLHIHIVSDQSLWTWQFQQNGENLAMLPSGQLVFTSLPQIITACLDGFGIAYLPDFVADEWIERGQLISLLPEHCISLPPLYLFYPERRLHTPVFELVLGVLKEG